ncbi:hypothetical protein M8C21_002099 [Ambrosia artemisiifolia]|uniref:VQ domain-containing protein n=1 Tax=Ambrosia artemisiifolia TaxID=4212 RepID=A0AAD5CDC5_AMBAR|nr:hypothetical protein M8C21_002099 [Ambrosia artemisiifolia]
MDNPNYSRPSHSTHLGVNKIGKNIRKNPLPQSNFDNPTASRPVSQPQVYNINKNDFRNIVQQLTGSPSHHSQQPPSLPVPRPPPVNPSNSQTTRLQRIRPPPLSPLYDQFGQPRGVVQPWSNAAESPISAYARYLQHSINDHGNQQSQAAGLLPNPHGQVLPPFPSPRMSGQPPLLPSPGSQFLLPSPSAYLNLASPRSPYPLLSPGYQRPPPLSPNFPFSPGILGPGPQPPRSPGIGFPLSPGFFPDKPELYPKINHWRMA